ncbi:hypothetical protein ACP4OV_001817 [Aristida adscensionis]
MKFGCSHILLLVVVAAAAAGHVLVPIYFPEPFQYRAYAYMDIPLIYAFRHLLRRRSHDAGPLLRFRLQVGVAILYLVLSGLFFVSVAHAMPWWGAMLVWAIALLAVELGFAFFNPCTPCSGEAGHDIENPRI